MSNYVLSATLELRDKLTTSIENAKRSTISFERTFKSTGSLVSSVAKKMELGVNKIEKTTTSLVKSIVKLGAAGVSGVAGAGAYAIKSAADMERYRSVLEAVLKDEQKAANTMSWANKFANSTPYQNAEVIEGVVRLSSAGLAKENMTFVGDLAAAAGKPLMQAVEAILDAQTGELERLKELNITKDMIKEHAAKIGVGDLINAKGQITDLKAFNIVLKDLIELKFGGTMEKNADTFYGAMSTTIGTIKSAITQIAGIGLDGKIITGSMFDYIRNKAIEFRTVLEKMQEDGSLGKITQRLGKAFSEIIPHVENAVKALKDNWKPENIETIIKGTGVIIGELGETITSVSNLIQKFPVEGIGAFKKFADDLPPFTKKIITIVGAATASIIALRAAAGDPIAIAEVGAATAVGGGAIAGTLLGNLLGGIYNQYQSWKNGYNVEPVATNWETWKEDKELITKLETTGEDPLKDITGIDTADSLRNLYNYKQPSASQNNSPFFPSKANAQTFTGDINYSPVITINGSNLNKEELEEAARNAMNKEFKDLKFKMMGGVKFYGID